MNLTSHLQVITMDDGIRNRFRHRTFWIIWKFLTIVVFLPLCLFTTFTANIRHLLRYASSSSSGLLPSQRRSESELPPPPDETATGCPLYAVSKSSIRLFLLLSLLTELKINGYVPPLLLLFQGGFAIPLDSNWIVWACFYPEKPAILGTKKHRNYPVLKS